MLTLPDLPYRPGNPKQYRPRIGLIGCGGISQHHLAAYRNAQYQVTALCDPILDRAKKMRDTYFPEAKLFEDYTALLSQGEIEVVDITTHPNVRVPIIEAALKAKKHVLSQKPFVLDLEVGEKLVTLAQEQNVKLAVNQNGRWAPHFAYLRESVNAGLLGDLSSLEFSLQFDHNWTFGTPFDGIHHLILYDFAIHWFDLIHVLMQREATLVYSQLTHTTTQRATPPLLAQTMIRYEHCLVSFTINGDATLSSGDRTLVVGNKGSILSEGPGLNTQTLTFMNSQGSYSPKLEGAWFDTGFHGSMAELLCAVEEQREPSNSAKQNLGSLALCFAALASADLGTPQKPGQARKVEI